MGGKGSGGHGRIHEPKVLVDDGRELWVRQHGESRQAFEAFAIYRDLSVSRSQRLVAEKLGKSQQLMGRWGVLWSWTRRADAWDAYLDAEARRETVREVIDMQKRQINIAEAMQVAGGEVIIRLATRLQAGDKGVKLSTNEARKLIDVGVRIERLNRGEPGEINEERVINVEDATDEQLERIARGEKASKVLKP